MAIGTPGRIRALLAAQVLPTGSIRMVILDEADQLMQASFQEDMQDILQALPGTKQVPGCLPEAVTRQACDEPASTHAWVLQLVPCCAALRCGPCLCARMLGMCLVAAHVLMSAQLALHQDTA